MDPNLPTDQYQDQMQSESTPKQSVVARVQQAQNVLVTVKTNPSVDELAATIGLTLMLNKLGKHATAVFSGEVPSTLEFLRPEETIETNTDSLRDFIVSLDKSKADKLRYKVEENVVKIFITPYRTSITQDDLEFTQGDFNVDVVLALGVTQREELDQAIMAHGRILHDATVVTVTAGQDYSELGQINWQEAGASSLCEMLVSVSEAFQGGLIDEQIATAFLTGIVAETERFSNTKTSPKVMTMSAQLMAAGANQQLIANELEKEAVPEVQPALDQPTEGNDIAINNDGTLTIPHDQVEEAAELPEVADEPTAEEAAQPEASVEEPLLPPSESEFTQRLPDPEPQPEVDTFNPLMPDESEPADEAKPKPEPEPAAPSVFAPTAEPQSEYSEPVLPPLPPTPEHEPDTHGDIHIDTEGNMVRKSASEPKHKVIQPLPAEEPAETPPIPNMEVPAPAALELSLPEVKPDTEPAQPNILPPAPELDLTPSAPIQDNTTIEQLEQSVNSHHTQEQTPPAGVDNARNAVMDAFQQRDFDPAHNPREGSGANFFSTPPPPTSFDSYRLDDGQAATSPSSPVTDVSGNLPQGFLSSPEPTVQEPQPQNAQADYSIPPPPVPPPMMPR